MRSRKREKRFAGLFSGGFSCSGKFVGTCCSRGRALWTGVGVGMTWDAGRGYLGTWAFWGMSRWFGQPSCWIDCLAAWVLTAC